MQAPKTLNFHNTKTGPRQRPSNECAIAMTAAPVFRQRSCRERRLHNICRFPAADSRPRSTLQIVLVPPTPTPPVRGTEPEDRKNTYKVRRKVRDVTAHQISKPPHCLLDRTSHRYQSSEMANLNHLVGKKTRKKTLFEVI